MPSLDPLNRNPIQRVALAFAILMLVVGSYTIVKSVRDAIFLSRFGITELSMMSIGLALITSFVVSVYIRTTAGLPRNLLILGTNGLIASTLVLFWIGLGASSQAGWLPWGLYIWSSVFGVFTVMQFWLLASDLFDPREAKRFFGVVGAGAILGGISGGFLSRALAAAISTRGLLLVSAGMLVLAALLAHMVWPLRRRDLSPAHPGRRQKTGSGGGFGVLRDEPYVRLIAGALLLATMATTLLDWQFKGIVKLEFAGRTDEMAGYFGALYGYLSVASFIFQALLTGWILRRFGVGVGLLLLPLGMAGGSLGILFHGMLPFGRLTAASGAKVAEGGLRFAIDKASMELMWMPVDPQTKERGKAFVDTVIDRLGTGITGIIWLALAFFGFDEPNRLHLISVVCLVAIAAWLTVVWRARKAYSGALRDTLSRRSLDLSELQSSFVDASAKAQVTTLLQSEQAGEVHFGLFLAGDLPGSLPDLSAALQHKSPLVRVAAFALAAQASAPGYRPTAARALLEDDPQLQRAALGYLRSTAGVGQDPIFESLEEMLQKNEAPQGSAANSRRMTVAVAKLTTPTYALSAAEDLRKFLGTAPMPERLRVLRLLAAAPPEMAGAVLAPLLSATDLRLRRTAIQSAGKARSVALLPSLLPLLDERSLRPWVATALTEMCPESISTVLRALALDQPEMHRDQASVNSRQGASQGARVSMLRVLGSSNSSHVTACLMTYLRTDVDDRLVSTSLASLSRLARHSMLSLDEDVLKERLRHEIVELFHTLLAIGLGSWSDIHQVTKPTGLFEIALREAADEQVARIFRILGLLHGPTEMDNAHRALRSPIKSTRASSLEFLDNRVDREYRATLLGLLEGRSHKQIATDSKRHLGQSADLCHEDYLRRLLQGHNGWLRAVAAWRVGQHDLKPLRPDLLALREQQTMGIRAVAKRAIARLDAPQTKEPAMGLTVVEKVLKLQSVDVFQAAAAEDLAHIAQIATEIEFDERTPVYAAGDLPDALYVVLSGAVRLHHDQDGEIAKIGPGEAFGSWALLDEAPRVASATTEGTTTLLRVDRSEFLELLADRVDIVQAVFKAMVGRLRKLASLAPPTEGSGG